VNIPTSNKSSPSQVTFSSVIDQRGRIIIPSDIRRSFGLSQGFKVEFSMSFFKGKLFFEIKNINDGCGGVKNSTRACGALGPGEKEPKCKAFPSATSGRGPQQTDANKKTSKARRSIRTYFGKKKGDKNAKN
jgi:AbrB family looped-hinge helix DNA binding protein